MKAFKLFFSVMGLFIVIAILTLGALIYFIDPNKLKPVIVEEVQNKTGYQLTIDGQLSWSFYPLFSVKAEHVQVLAPAESKPFLTANGVHIAVRLIDLWQRREIMQGKVSISSLALGNLKLENVSSDIFSKKNELTFDSLNAKLYGGTLHATVTATNVAISPEWKWEAKLNNVQLNPLLKDLNGADSKINVSGVANFSMQAGTKGKTREDLLGQLKGNAAYQIQDGVLDGMDLNYFVQLADASLNKQATDRLVNSKQTTFSQLNGSFVIKNGVAETRDTVLLATAFTSNAQGKLELLSRKLDFSIQIKPQLQNAKRSFDIPVLLSGDLRHPDIALDFLFIQKMIAEKQLEKFKEKASVEIQKHVPGKAGEFLQKLLGK